jgi:YfiR/HmsC-like
MSARVPHLSHIAPPSTLGLRRFVRGASALLCLLLCVMVCRVLYADSGAPLNLQALLLARLCNYDRNFKARAAPVAKVLVMRRKGDPDSTFEATGLAKAIADLHDIGGLPYKVEEAIFSDAESLAKRCRADKVAILYLTVGLEGDTARIASALSNIGVLTVGSSARHAENGAVLGFGVEEARPKLVINLKQAVAQNVNFKAEVLALARLIQ